MTGESIMNISVIICTFNRGEYLRKVLVDLAKQDNELSADHEVIIVDNNSRDATKKICEEFVAVNPEIFRYIFEERQGKTFALNTGIRESKGKIIAFTDDDVIIDSKWLLSIQKAFAANPDCKAFGGRVVALWPDTVPAWIAKEGSFENIGGTIAEHDYGNAVKCYPQTVQEGMVPPIGANMFFAREIFEKYGYFNEKLNSNIKTTAMPEDTEFCNRLLKNREKMIYIPEALVYHPVYNERLTKKYFRTHSFKIGRAQPILRNLHRNGQYVMISMQKNKRRFLNVPLYLYRSVVTDLIKYLVAFFRRNPQEILHLEKILFYYMGIIYELFDKRKIETSTDIDLIVG